MKDEEMLWPWLWRFLLVVGGTFLAAALVGFGLAHLSK